MPRAARLVLPDLALHVLQRGNNRADCFFQNADYIAYLRYLGYCARHFDCSVHAYCLMTNHVHLLLTPHSAPACARFMKALGQSYTQYINRSAGRTGSLWEGRFRSCLIDSSDYVFTCYRYIELNPVRAGMVQHPADYPWSSHMANAQGSASLVTPHPAYLQLSEQEDARRKVYREMFGSHLDARLVEEVRKATRSGTPVGGLRRPRGRPTTKIGTDPISGPEKGSVPI
jgi:putative transposase